MGVNDSFALSSEQTHYPYRKLVTETLSVPIHELNAPVKVRVENQKNRVP
jgi:hypothetical protein